jgi:hypothetical protein
MQFQSFPWDVVASEEFENAVLADESLAGRCTFGAVAAAAFRIVAEALIVAQITLAGVRRVCMSERIDEFPYSGHSQNMESCCDTSSVQVEAA